MLVMEAVGAANYQPAKQYCAQAVLTLVHGFRRAALDQHVHSVGWHGHQAHGPVHQQQ